jgi:uncharacterized protein YndB with AHSA1/START domain
MPTVLRVELQAEVDGQRDELFELVASSKGLLRWVDDADVIFSVGGAVRLKLRDAWAVGRILAIDPAQHISWTWDWEAKSLGTATVVAFDLIDHGKRTHLTLRHVGFRSRAQLELHDALWRYWFARLVAATEVEAGVTAGVASPQR